MTSEQLLSRLKVLLDKYEALLVESEGWKKQGVQGVEPSFFSGQIDSLVTVCADLEALTMEATGRPMPFEHTCDNPPRAGIAGVSMQHEVNYCVDTLMCLGPSDLRKVAQQLAADDPAQAERLRRALDVLPEGYQRAVILPPVVRPEFHVDEDE